MNRSLRPRDRRGSWRNRREHQGRFRLGMERLENRFVLTGDIVISEFMAVNDATLADEDGRTSDWLELFNTSDSPVDLNGWYLTDDATDLTKWQFPNVTIGADEFLVVFASDKDRTAPNSELHTNFKLTSAGEYLALVQSDGTTISHEYGTVGGVTFPEQLPDVSYGVEQTTLNYGFVASGAEVAVLVPTSAGEDLPAATWTSVGYDDGSWPTHNQGIGFDGGGELLGELSENGNIGAEMQGNTASAYVRAKFNIDGAVPELDALTMNVNFDDGYVAYLNGVEVATRNAPATRDWSSQATQNHGGELLSVDFDGFSDGDLRNLFTLNGRSQFVGDRLQVTRSSADQTGATWLTEPLVFGADYSFSTAFAMDIHSPGGISFLEAPDADGNGGQGMTFVLQAGGPFQLGGGRGELGLDNAGMTFVAVEFDTFASGSFDADNTLPTHIGIDTSADGSVARVGVPRFNGGSQGDNPRYVWVDYDGFTDTMDVYYSETDSKPGAPTLSSTVDLESLFGGVPSLWAGFTGATSFNWNAHEVLDWEITTFSSELGLTTETVDLSEHIGLLLPGSNVLAIHGLNLNASDDDFLINVTLAGALHNVTFLDSLAYFAVPSPGEPNGSGSERPAAKVEFSLPGSTFIDSVTVQLATEDPDATIRYTTDGTLPSDASTEYVSPITISATTRIRARAFKDGQISGAVQTQSYVRLDPSLTNFEGSVFASNLPIIVLDSFGDTGADMDSLNFHSVTTLVYDVGSDGVASLANEPDFSGPAGARRRGQSAQGWPKGMYALEYWKESIDFTGAIDGKDGPDRNVGLLGLPADSDWVLNGPYSDKTHLNNVLAFDLYRKLGLETPRTRFVELFLNVDGGSVDYAVDYRGTYVLMEKIKIDENRLDLDDAIANPAPDADPTTVGGYIFKQDKDGAGDVNFRTEGHGGPSVPLKFVEPDTPTGAQETWLTNFVNEFEEVLYSDEFTDPVNGYAKYIEVDTFVDHWLITELSKENNGFRLSEYFFVNPDGKIEKGLPWDLNTAFSNSNYLEGGIVEGFYSDLIGGAQYHWYPRLFEDPAFQVRIEDRWFELRENEFSFAAIEATIDEAVAMLTNGSPNFDRPAPGEPSNPISRNFERWGTIDMYLWPNCYFPSNSPPQQCGESPLPPEMSPNGAPNSYDDYIFIMKFFIENRLEWIDSAFGRPPNADPSGGIVAAGTEVILSSQQNGTIYFTTDGSDPRQPEIVETVRSVFPSGNPESQVVVPADDTLIQACVETFIFLPNPENCFVSPDYPLGQHGETWTPASGGIGYDSGDQTFADLIDSDIGALVEGVNATVYVRIPFEVTQEQLDEATRWDLHVNYDDGIVAYTWFHELDIPREVFRRNAPGASPFFPIAPLPHDATAIADRSDADAIIRDTIPIFASFLHVGTNYLVFQLLNAHADSDDLLLDIDLTYTDESAVFPPNVSEFTEPIVVRDDVVIKSRTFDEANNLWSAQSTQAYVVAIPGDTDLDGDVDVEDLNTLGLNWQSDFDVGWEQGDFDRDGIVDVVDLNTLALNWRTGVEVAARVPRAPLAMTADVVDMALVHEFGGLTADSPTENAKSDKSIAGTSDNCASTSDTWPYRRRFLHTRNADGVARRTSRDAQNDNAFAFTTTKRAVSPDEIGQLLPDPTRRSPANR